MNQHGGHHAGVLSGLNRSCQIINEIYGTISNYHSAHADSEYSAGYNRALADAERRIKTEVDELQKMED